jgi:hypothetical protein
MITIVSGLPRSGTSMMMKILETGGISLLTDNVREADEDNMNGYYEFERAKNLKEDKAWLDEADGKAVKIISYLLNKLPPQHDYKVIFMKRNIEEILASQKRMIERRGEAENNVPDSTMSNIFEKHLSEIHRWMESQPNLEVLYVSYNEVMRNPKPALKNINHFLGGGLNVKKMSEVINPSLYRQRK